MAPPSRASTGRAACTQVTSAYNARLAAPAVVMPMPAMSATAYGDGDEKTGLSADGHSEEKQQDPHITHRLPPCS